MRNKGDFCVNFTFTLLVFILIFEILIRAVVPNSDNLINIIKALLCLIMIIYIIIINKSINLKYGYLHITFCIFLVIILLKILNERGYNGFINWIISNNNINYFFIYVYFVILFQLKNRINMNSLYKVLKIFNYIIIIISIILFLTNNYLGMVSYENMLAYAWVGTNKSRVMSIFGNPNHAGLYFVLMLFIMDYQRVKEKKGIICIENILLMFMNFCTFSRTSIVINIIYIFIRLKILENYKKKNVFSKLMRKYKLIIVSIIFIIGVSILVNNFGVYFFNINYILNTSRWERWGIGLKYMMKYPFIGVPFDKEIIGLSSNLTQLKFSDNMFIEIGARFGSILITLILIYILNELFNSIKIRNYIKLNKLQALIISSILSGTIHFSVALFLFLIYFILCKDDLQNINIDKAEV